MYLGRPGYEIRLLLGSVRQERLGLFLLKSVQYWC
jgi:hypothetical protein